MGTHWTNGLKNHMSQLGEIVRYFIVIVQRGYDQLMDILLMGWWWSKEKSASSAFRPKWSGVYILVGHIPSLIVNFSSLEGVSVSAK